MKYIIAIILILLTQFQSFAQMEQKGHLEFPKNAKFEEEIEVLPLGKDGLLVTIKQEGYARHDEAKWFFHRYDNLMKEKWITSIKPEYDLKPHLSYHTSEFLYWLFIEKDTPHISIVRLNLALGEVDEFKGDLLGNVEIDQFKVLGNTAYIGGDYVFKPVVIAFSFFTQTSKVLHGLYSKNLDVNALEVDEMRNELNVILNEKVKGKCGLAVQTYSYEGNWLRTIHVPSEDGGSLSFITGKMLNISESETFLIGNYSHNCTDFSKGIYLTRLEDGEQKGTSTIRFSELKNFFNFMNPKRLERVKEKIEMKKKQGKELNFSYKLLIHNLIPTEKGSLLLAEIYFPQPRYNVNMSNPLMTNRTSERMETFNFTHAVVCEFDKQGKILWDNALIMDNVESLNLANQVQLNQNDNQFLMAFIKKGKVFIQTLQDGKWTDEKSEFEIRPDPNAKIDEDASVAAWQEQSFLTWGTKKGIVKKGEEQTVFYVDHLGYTLKPSPK
jgi:hypothetical protein